MQKGHSKLWLASLMAVTTERHRLKVILKHILGKLDMGI
jgi:hypothetical protein